MPETIVVDLTPTPNGTFNSTTATLSVSTNNATGYALYLSAVDGTTTLKSDTSEYQIASVSGTPTPANFTNNTWGYNLSTASVTDATTYSAIPTSSADPVLTTDSAATDNYNLTIAAKVDTAIPAGTYTSEIVASVVANPTEAIFNNITDMQEMTSEICASAAENDTKQLIDSRDGKSYWVAKLKDGNCWMTQSLDYDIPASGLTSADSDVTDAWNSSSTYRPQPTSKSIFNNSDYTGTYSWDPGMYVKTNPTDYSNYCGGPGLNITSFANSYCTSAGWTDVSTMTAMTEENTSGNVISGDTYDAHYLVGNFYQWNATTAGTGKTITNQEATDSICPKGWHLPTSNNTNKGSFYYLLNQYGMANSTNDGQIANSPVYFQYSGIVGSGSLKVAGGSGYYWSSTAGSATSGAYNLDVDATSVNPSSSFRYYGFSVRCLAD